MTRENGKTSTGSKSQVPVVVPERCANAQTKVDHINNDKTLSKSSEGLDTDVCLSSTPEIKPEATQTKAAKKTPPAILIELFIGLISFCYLEANVHFLPYILLMYGRALDQAP